ncbi:MAG: glutamate 5-kinase [Chloroflexota bacterium]|nr:glutamate 5-kinase [Chloroflexota bacterium]
MSSHTLVVKAGTGVLLKGTAALDRPNIARLLNELIDAREQGRRVIFVSSGAIGAGLAPLGFKRRPVTIPDLQACAAVGQSLLMQAYNEVLAQRGYVVAQLLLTYDDFQDRRRYLNLRNTLAGLQDRRVLPIINENDTISIDEIRFGDNDVLSALVASAVDAALTIVLSDVAGLYTANPRVDPTARLIPVVEGVTPEIEALAGVPDSAVGVGGMASKIRAAKTITSMGGTLVVADGKKASVTAILGGGIERGEVAGTVFRPSGDRLDHRKRWIAHTLKEQGELIVDAGAARALVERGKSLLPAGVIGCEGHFVEGDPVVVWHDDRRIAKGLTNYSADQVRQIMGKKSSEIAGLLGGKIFDEVIHRNNMVRL